MCFPVKFTKFLTTPILKSSADDWFYSKVDKTIKGEAPRSLTSI